jgi:PKD repeat protein
VEFRRCPCSLGHNGVAKNLATGGVAAHVFESPGTYTVTLTVTDGVNSQTTTSTITVQDPNTVFAGTLTLCVSASALPVAGVGGCPAGAAVLQSNDFPTIVNTYAQHQSACCLSAETYSVARHTRGSARQVRASSVHTALVRSP